MLDCNPSLALAAPDEGPSRRKYNYITNIAHRDWNLSISDGPNPIITFKKNNQDISVYAKNNQKIYELNFRAGEKLFDVFVKGNKVGLLVTARGTLYNEDACIFSPDPFAKVLSNDLPTKIEDVAYSDDFFGGTCAKLNQTEKDKFRFVVSKELNPSTSYLMTCLTSESFKKEALKNKDLALTANKLITRYVDELTKIQSGTSDLKIECEAGEKAKYDPKRTAMVFPIKGDAIPADACKSNDQVFTHEFFHHSGFSETDAASLDKRCIAESKTPKNKSCLEAKGPRAATEAGPAALLAAQKDQKKATAQQREQIAPVLAAEIKTADFVPVQDADIQEISNPSSPATYEASVERVHRAMSTNLENMAAPLNRAIASTVSTARAETAVGTTTRESINKTTTAKSRLPASAKANDNEEYVVEEILADKYNVPVETIRAASVAAPAPSTSAATVATKAAAPKATRAPGEVAGTNAGPGGGEIAGSNAGGGGGSSISGGGGVAGRSVSAGAKFNSRLPASAGAAVGSDPLVEQLGQFNEVRGTKYRQLKDRYDDPSFEPELKAKNIAIEYRQNNKTTIIGDTSDKRTLFRDDGTVLKKVTGAR
jgi:hypothetical protein